MTQAIASTHSPSELAAKLRWTRADLDLLPDNGNRYEIIDGELFVTRAPHSRHQKTCGRLFAALDHWSRQTGLGEAELGAGLLLDNGDDVIPDVIWMRRETYANLIDESGHFRGAPELVIEVLSAGGESVGGESEKRDRQVKLKLYSVTGVLEYWIADWRTKQVQVFRRSAGGLQLTLTFLAEDVLTSPLLPDFACPLQDLFPD